MTERHIWLLDDTDHWHDVCAATVAACPGWRFRGFFSSRDLFYGFDEVDEQTDQHPTVLLMDYFLRGERGDQVTSATRRRPLPGPLTIVAHSSTVYGNQAIMQAGADCTVRKRAGSDGINHELLQWLQDAPR